MQGLHDGAILNIIGCCNFTETESREVCTVLPDKGLFLYNRTTLAIIIIIIIINASSGPPKLSIRSIARPFQCSAGQFTVCRETVTTR